MSVMFVKSRGRNVCVTKLTNFFAGPDGTSAMPLKLHRKIATKAHDAAMLRAANAMVEAAQTVGKIARPSLDDEKQLQDGCAN